MMNRPQVSDRSKTLVHVGYAHLTQQGPLPTWLHFVRLFVQVHFGEFKWYKATLLITRYQSINC